MSETPEGKLVCPNCQHENEPNSTRCSQCGTELVKTVSVPDISTGLMTRFPSVPEVEVVPDALTMIVSGFKTPLSVERKREIVIGRRVPDHPLPDVDLASYNAYKLGVSRRHAVLRCSESGCAIEDQASANATWVNENKLTPFVPYLLQSGDTIRLGHLVLHVYFSAIDSVYLHESGEDVSIKLTPDYVVKTLGPYLQALAAIQGVINNALDRDPTEVTMGSVRHDSGEAIQVTLRKATEAVNLALRRIMPWRNENASPKTDEEKSAYEEKLKGLIEVLIDRINPDVSTEHRPTYTKQLVEPVRVLITSPLIVTESPPRKKPPLG
jgi:pSer/pThr/pTyr-binding forkhead associated (FHA) protein